MMYILSLLLAVGTAGLEAVSYLGFIAKHTGISAYFFYIVSSVVAIVTKNKPKIAVTLLKIGSLGASALLIILNALEVGVHRNFVFTATHINLVSYQVFVFLLVTHYFLAISKKIDVARIGRSILIGILVCVASGGFGKSLGFMGKSVSVIAKDPFASYEEKMIKAYPGLYPALKEVVELTPEDTTIYIPPQGNPWEYEGNGALVTYFIYPRKAVNLPDTGIVPQIEKTSYILIAKGSWPELKGPLTYGWPKVPIKSNRLWRINVSSRTADEFQKSYDPNSDQWEWGLIEVKP